MATHPFIQQVFIWHLLCVCCSSRYGRFLVYLNVWLMNRDNKESAVLYNIFFPLLNIILNRKLKGTGRREREREKKDVRKVGREDGRKDGRGRGRERDFEFPANKTRSKNNTMSHRQFY